MINTNTFNRSLNLNFYLVLNHDSGGLIQILGTMS